MVDQDELIMTMLHYFITKKDYNPIILHGAKNEIWLENLEEEYRIVRIISNYIHNNDQLDFDLFKTKKIGKQIKGKTLTLNLNILNIYTNLGDNVDLEKVETNKMKCLNIKKIGDFKKYSDVLEIYPKLDKKPETLKGMDLFMKLTTEISEKTEKDAMDSEKIFSMKKPIITYSLIAINIIVFALMYILGNGSTDTLTLIKFGANNAEMVRLGEYYRLFTSTFLHIGLIHLVFNMYALYIIGPQIESFFGKTKYLLIYILGGIIGNLFANIFEVNTIGAGASGAIFALFGALLYFGYHYRVYLGSVIRTQIVPVILINLAVSFMSSGISAAAHIGGLIGGILVSMAVGVPKKSSKAERVNGTIVTILLIGFLVYMGIFR
ncbi:MAG: rhomboid family intramembrane serine protease [Bacilli bacterium]|nr:rhomboid family intramembrane serine protease [Bacilli bacterium]